MVLLITKLKDEDNIVHRVEDNTSKYQSPSIHSFINLVEPIGLPSEKLADPVCFPNTGNLI